MQITEELLESLGFVQQNPPYIWDYAVGKEYNYIRLMWQDYQGKRSWRLSYRNSPTTILTDGCDFMNVVRIIAMMSYSEGVRETQDKLHEALGLDRLMERAVDRVMEHRDN